MTKFEALIACRNHWSWLVITGDSNKHTYVPSDDWAFNCACCEFMKHDGNGVDENEKRVCSDCPLTGYAWEDDDDCAPCDEYDTNSFYYAWRWNLNKKYYAKRMVYACNQAINDFIIKGE